MFDKDKSGFIEADELKVVLLPPTSYFTFVSDKFFLFYQKNISFWCVEGLP